MEVTARHRSGREFPVEVTISGPIQSDERVVEAVPGDIFLFLTDGILEARDRHDDEFGYEGIQAALRNTSGLNAAEIREVLLQSLASHCENLEASDDQAMIVFRVAGSATNGART
jgi:serine phosphatase RsbU (regulator of sigma subunit)